MFSLNTKSQIKSGGIKCGCHVFTSRVGPSHGGLRGKIGSKPSKKIKHFAVSCAPGMFADPEMNLIHQT